MPITLPPFRGGRLASALFAGLSLCSAFSSAPSLQASEVGVAIVRSAAWSANAAAREGAEELAVLMSVAQLQKNHRLAGLVGVGDKHGMFKPGTEQTLRFVALTGVAVVRVSPNGFVPPADGLFIEAAQLTESQVKGHLQDCLVRFGAPPRARDPDRPTAAELSSIRSHLRKYQESFIQAAAPSVAMK
jgi:hypothetical protein